MPTFLSLALRSPSNGHKARLHDQVGWARAYVPDPSAFCRRLCMGGTCSSTSAIPCSRSFPLPAIPQLLETPCSRSFPLPAKRSAMDSPGQRTRTPAPTFSPCTTTSRTSTALMKEDTTGSEWRSCQNRVRSIHTWALVAAISTPNTNGPKAASKQTHAPAITCDVLSPAPCLVVAWKNVDRSSLFCLCCSCRSMLPRCSCLFTPLIYFESSSVYYHIA